MDSNGTAIGFLLRDRRKHIHVGSRATSLSHSVPQKESDTRTSLVSSLGRILAKV